MAPKYQNQNPVPLFGQWEDPYADRRGVGQTHPADPLPCAKTDFHRAFLDDRLYFSWLGHSSVFLHMDGKSILIDPVFCRYASPVPFFGPKRFPGFVPRASDFPEIDLLLITHSHYDHLDKKAIRRLNRQVKRFIAPKGVGDLLHRFGVSRKKITELGWYDEFALDGLTVTCTPSQHDSARTPFDLDQTLWCSYVLKNKDFSVYDCGDGGFAGHFQEIYDKFGSFDLGIMECGQYNTRWHAIHMFPEESVEAAKILGAKVAVPVHWGAYVLSDHPWDDPPKRFSRRAQELGVACRLPKLYEILEIEKEENHADR